MSASWKPARDEAEFIGQVTAIDAGLAGIVADQLRKGQSLSSVRHTLECSATITESGRRQL